MYEDGLHSLQFKGGQVDSLELCVFCHGLEGLLGLVFVGGQELQNDLLVGIDFLIVFFLFSHYVFVELSKLSQLVLIVFDLPVEVESRSLLFEGALFLLSCVGRDVRLGKKR
jgi:hypothetical protein